MPETDSSQPSRTEELSHTGTFRNEATLPRVRLPNLGASGTKLLEWCAPLVGDDELTETESALAALRSDVGPRLQETLREYDNTSGVDSWLDRFWEFRYLGRRDRIAADANFFLLLDDTRQPESGTPQLDRAARLVNASVAYKLALDRAELPPDIANGEPLSMAQHRYLFATTRIPGFAVDTVRAPYTTDSPGPATSRHIAVFYRGNVFRVDVVTADGQAHSPDDIGAALGTVAERGAVAATAETAVGALTTRERAQWAASRQGLVAHDRANEDALDTVESALLCLCLDDTVPDGPEQACAQLMHGPAGNRWFDKSLSLIVFADGTAGINAESSQLDVATVTSFVDTVCGTDGVPRAVAGDGVSRGEPAVAAVEFALDEALRANVRVAAEEFAAHVATLGSRSLSVTDFGAETITEADAGQGLTAAAFLQLAHHLAHRRSHGFVPATYEPVGMRQYRHGRTEALRPVTAAAVRFVDTMDDPDASTATRRAALLAAARARRDRVAECRTGEAPEQHLWELQRIARQQGRKMGIYEVPELFGSPGWEAMRADRLSIMGTASSHVRYLGTGPAEGPGIGASHVVSPHDVSLHLSAQSDVEADVDLDKFRDELARALTELRDLLTPAT